MASSSRGGGGGSSSSSTFPLPPFLFVVTKLNINLNPEDGGVHPEYDHWGNVHPPTDLQAYVSEQVSHVIRYADGRCTRADGYRFRRPDGWHTRGAIEAPETSSRRIFTASEYSSATVFCCSAHLPIVVTDADATVEETTVFSGESGGGGYYNNQPELPKWARLSFRHGHDHLRGVSQALSNGRRVFVAGRDPTWIPSLVPTMFRHPRERVPGHEEAQNHENQPPRSRGLGGELAVVLGLMAFAASSGVDFPTAMNRAFLSREAYWRGGRWHLDRPLKYPSYEDTPHGYYVHVCLDEYFPTSTYELLRHFETAGGGIIVGG